MNRPKLIEMARHNMQHVEAGTVPLAPGIAQIPVENYFDRDRWQLEMDRVFKRVPLMLAMTTELPNPGDYKCMDIVGTPLIICRGEDGAVRTFVNMCSHRGAQLVGTGTGNTHRFTCPYHAWSYNVQGELIGIFAKKEFGEVDHSCNGLTPLPTLERAGLIWVTLNPDSNLPAEDFLSGYDDMLAHFGFENWTLFESRVLPGPNWKVAYDGYLDLYHLPILHKNTFGSQFPHSSLYYAWGPHQRVSSPDPSLLNYKDKPESEWPEQHLMTGVWTIFPHISIAGFEGGGRSVMLSQLFPGDTPEESFTVQNYLMEKPPVGKSVKEARDQFKFLEYVVAEEDYATGLGLQKALKTRAKSHLMFGRNEEGGQRFHRWLDVLLATPDEDLPKLFADPNAVNNAVSAG